MMLVVVVVVQGDCSWLQGKETSSEETSRTTNNRLMSSSVNERIQKIQECALR